MNFILQRFRVNLLSLYNKFVVQTNFNQADQKIILITILSTYFLLKTHSY